MAAQSGSGAAHRHAYYRLPDGGPVHRLCVAHEYDILSNGYVIAPPSITTGPYTWLTLLWPVGDLPEAPAWAVNMLLEAKRAADAKPPPAERPKQLLNMSDRELLDFAMSAKNGDKLRRLHTGDLTAHDGKDRSHSGADLAYLSLLTFYTQDEAQLDRLYLASGLARPEHWRGTYRAATLKKALNRRDFYEPAGGGPTSTFSSNGHAEEEAPKPEPATPPPWELPLPLNDTVALPTFPTEALPAPIRAMVDEVAAAYQVPGDLAAFMALAVLSTCAARRVTVEVWPGWREPVNLYLVVVLQPAERKTAIVRELTAPLEAYERNQIARMRDTIAQAKAERDLLEAGYKAAIVSAARTTGDEQRAAEGDARALAVELANHEVPATPRLLVDDATPEKLVSMMAEQGGRIALLSAEGGLFEMMGGRYSKSGQLNLDVYLKSHAGDSIRIDRRSREPEYIAAPALTLGLAVQPIVLDGLLDNPAFRGRGVVARFLYALPNPMVGRRKPRTGEVPARIVANYADVVGNLLKLEPARADDGAPMPHVLKMSAQAAKALEEFAKQLEPRLIEFGDLGHLADWGGKLSGAVARIAALLHLAIHHKDRKPWETPVSDETVSDAAAIAEYMIAHAKAVYGRMGADPDIAGAERVLRWLNERGSSVYCVHSETLVTITRRDIHQGLRASFPKPGDLDRPLTVLVEHGYLRPHDVEVTGPGRKPSPTFQVNPHIAAQNTLNPQNGWVRS